MLGQIPAREAGVNVRSSGTDSDMGVEDRY